MLEKFAITLYVNERGFYVQTRHHRERMEYVQQSVYGPLTADEVLQVCADAPVPAVVEMSQRRLF